MENQKWKISFKIIDSRNFWVVHPIKMIIDSYKGRYTLGDKLQQHATHRSDKSFRVYLRIFVKIVVSATEFCRSNMLQKIKSDRICATCRGDKILLQRQRFSQNFCSTHEAICRCDVSPRLVAATCRLVCTDLKGRDLQFSWGFASFKIFQFHF